MPHERHREHSTIRPTWRSLHTDGAKCLVGPTPLQGVCRLSDPPHDCLPYSPPPTHKGSRVLRRNACEHFYAGAYIYEGNILTFKLVDTTC